MKALVLTSSISVADAALIRAVTLRGHFLEIFDVANQHWVSRGPDHPAKNVPGWLNAAPLRLAGNAVNGFFARMIEGRDYDAVLTCGLRAGGAAGRHLEREFIPLLWSGELDFSPTRAPLTDDFRALTAATPCLFLEDDYEFDKALAKESRSAHFLHPAVGWPLERPIMSPATEDPPNVVLLHSETMPESRIQALRDVVAPVVARHQGTLRTLSVSSLYRHHDAQRRRPVESVVRTRLEPYTHVMLVGSSRDHGAVADLLLAGGAAGRLVVEDTIAMASWCRRTRFTRSGRGARLAELLDEVLTGSAERPDVDSLSMETVEKTDPSPDPLDEVVRRYGGQYSPDHEDLEILSSDGPVDIFFSTSPLEDRTNGARPQRVRNMAQAMSSRRPTIRMTSTPSIFERRRRLVQSMLESGRSAGLFYGENSTSPIPFESTTAGVGQLLSDFRQCGGHSVWFVRDLHWLDENVDYWDDPSQRSELVQLGTRELATIGGNADLLAVPSEAAIEGFTRLLHGIDIPPTPWTPLPPAVSAANVVPPAPAVPGAAQITLLYAGGVGSLYAMDSYLSAVAGLDPQRFALDFVVRTEEREQLNEFLASHGLQENARIRVLTDALDVYVPRPGVTIGTVLMDSEYARFTFLYKTVSFLEKGFPILTYRDMGIADFVTGLGIGEVCERSAQSLADTVEQMVVRDYSSAIRLAQQTQTWAQRLADVEVLAALATEKRSGSS